jgi:hypothetical protein
MSLDTNTVEEGAKGGPRLRLPWRVTKEKPRDISFERHGDTRSRKMAKASYTLAIQTVVFVIL